MSLTTTERTVPFQVPIPESMRTRLKMQALKQGITLRELTHHVLEQALNHFEKEEKSQKNQKNQLLSS